MLWTVATTEPVSDWFIKAELLDLLLLFWAVRVVVPVLLNIVNSAAWPISMVTVGSPNICRALPLNNSEIFAGANPGTVSSSAAYVVCSPILPDYKLHMLH